MSAAGARRSLLRVTSRLRARSSSSGVTPADHRELGALVKETLAACVGNVDEYAAGRFRFVHGGFEVAVLATERAFPAVRVEHQVMAVPETRRTEVMEFANALHARSSTMGAHWWLGDQCLWQVVALWSWTFDRRIFADQLGVFLEIAADRTPEIRARFADPTTAEPA
jgi:hypothetical protein